MSMTRNMANMALKSVSSLSHLPRSVEDVKSASAEAVWLLQNKISDEDDERVNMRLLVPSKVIGCLIGKNGSIINEMRKKTKADVRISKGEKPKHAAASDELVEVIGEVGNSRDAILQIILRLREHILKDKDGSQTNPPLDSRYSSSLPVSSVVPGVRQAGTLGYDHDQRAEAERGWECFQVAVYMGTILSRPEMVHIISFPRILLKVTQGWMKEDDAF
ncbi:KH domain-containing protein [Iris pallida]|uniref:KH domain-containing protein n=1 Tax=Iris pallida TaxID=29817 RepID=A0AAX6H7R2_IRIPA|nr:KH domain-containing protein [Iris pallida]